MDQTRINQTRYWLDILSIGTLSVYVIWVTACVLSLMVSGLPAHLGFGATIWVTSLSIALYRAYFYHRYI